MKKSKVNETPIYIQYAKDVVEGKVVTGLYVRLACQDYLNYIDSDEYELRRKVVDRAIKFIGVLRHFKGTKKTTTNFILEPWQQWIVSALVGVYKRGTDIRKHNNAYIEISRKNGKTALCAALALYFLIADGLEGAEVGCLANSREQAKIAYEFCEVWARQLDPSQKDLKSYRDRITVKPTNSKLIVCSSADDKLDGHGFTTAIVDEFHAAKSNKLRDVIKSSMVRENSLLLTITSAGFDKNGVCYQLRTTCTEILQGVKSDPSTFSAIYSLDDETDDWKDENVWVKSTPNLNVTVSTDYIRKQVQSAINNPSEESGVRTKTLGQWLSSSAIWVPDTYIMSAMKPVHLDDFDPNTTTIIGGLDLASVGDLTALSLLLTRDNDPTLYFKTFSYLPESALVESPNRELYKYWANTGQLTITPGNCADYERIKTDLVKLSQRFVIQKVGYDQWNSSALISACIEEGLNMEPVSQSVANLNRPTKELERLLRMNNGTIVIDRNEVTLFCFRNCVVRTDANDNVKLIKTNYENKIDNVVAMVMSLCTWLDTPRYFGGVSSI